MQKMKSAWNKFYNSDRFGFAVLISIWLVLFVSIYFFMEYFHLWLLLAFVVAFYVVIKAITLLIKALFRLL